MINTSSRLAALLLLAPAAAGAEEAIHLPDAEMVQAYEKAATQNVLAALNPAIFPGYWSVCADGIGHGCGNTFPALDGHQMADALLHLGEVDVVRMNWDYVRSFQRSDGQLPFAILPESAGKAIGPEGSQATVDVNGGLYTHWVKNNPLRALGYTTYIQNADALFRFTHDRDWLAAQLPSVNRAGDYLASLMAGNGAVGGAGYYVERPTRVEYDGVTQGHAMDAFRRLAALNEIAGDAAAAGKYEALADRIQSFFRTGFWTGDRFAEYIHPERGPIAAHGYTDADWTAVATGIATDEQVAVVWSAIRNEPRFRYNGVPTGIATEPESYEPWEFAHDDRMDLAAMGRVWYIECQARARMGDGAGLVDSIQQVCNVGREAGYYWRERYGAEGGYGVEKYCEYPANLIRVVQRFLLGVEHGLDGSLTLAPCVPDAYWAEGFGQTMAWQDRTLQYRFDNAGVTGQYRGGAGQDLLIRLPAAWMENGVAVAINGAQIDSAIADGLLRFALPASSAAGPVRFAVTQGG